MSDEKATPSRAMRFRVLELRQKREVAPVVLRGCVSPVWYLLLTLFSVFIRGITQKEPVHRDAAQVVAFLAGCCQCPLC